MSTQTQHSFSFKHLVVAATGVVFGDIGTSPLYALKEAFDPSHGVPFSENAVMGILSLLFWALVIVVSIKYVLFVMRANNHGEGGILALTALALQGKYIGRWALALMMLGIFGAAMFYGDAVITPAISVLSAVEGIQIATPILAPYVLPITITILFILFFTQKSGTAHLGKIFGPVMLSWFSVLAILGIYNILKAPHVLMAIYPDYAAQFIAAHTMQAYFVLGAVFLVLTGAEALYADMGHFGIRPIRFAWLMIVFPALVINYFGQGALILLDQTALKSPFYLMAPSWALWPLVVLATCATVIASQAVISGAFSLTSQAILLGYVPRMKILHTSAAERGQIYIPVVNWMLLLLIIGIVLAFKSSGQLAAAYGIAVTTTMVITTILAFVVMIDVWQWNKIFVTLIVTLFLTVDFAFFGANLVKIKEGGWLPLVFGCLIFFLVMTWHKGRELLRYRTALDGVPLAPFIQGLLAHPPYRVSGTAIYLTGNASCVPVALLHNLKHNKVLHERTILMTFHTIGVPYAEEKQRITVESLGGGLYTVLATFGFNETPDVQMVLRLVEVDQNTHFDLMDTSFFLARETVIPTHLPGMSSWRERIFAWMHQNAAKPSDFFSVPANRVVELGTKIEI